MINHLLFFSGQSPIAVSVGEESLRAHAMDLMDQAAQTSGGAMILPLVTALDAFRTLQDGAGAARAQSLLVGVRFTYALEQLFEEIMDGFESGLYDPFASAAGPKKSVQYFRLVLEEAEVPFFDESQDKPLATLLRFARRFIDRAETGQWAHLKGWASSIASATSSGGAHAFSPEARAGLHLFEAWLALTRQEFAQVTEELLCAIRLIPRERGGRLHYFAGLSFILPPDASMNELHRATAHFRDARNALEAEGQTTHWIRQLLATTYERLARHHTEGNPILRGHFEDQAFQALMNLDPVLPQARVITWADKNRRGWWSRLWR